MTYTAAELADLSNINTKTLKLYKEKNLLIPTVYPGETVPLYGQKELLRLQQILFFKELGLNLMETKIILDSPVFNLKEALLKQRNLLRKKMDRLDGLISTIDHTLDVLEGEPMKKDQMFYTAFNDEQTEECLKKILHRYKLDSSGLEQKKQNLFMEGDYSEILTTYNQIFSSLKEKNELPPEAVQIQKEIKRLHLTMNRFFECPKEIFRGIGRFYMEHEGFIALITKQFGHKTVHLMEQAINYYCET